MRHTDLNPATQPSTVANRRRVLQAAGAAALVSASPMAFAQAGRKLKVGFISPQTGPLAGFGSADEFVLAGVRKAIGDGITIGGKKSTRSRSWCATASPTPAVRPRWRLP